MFVLIMGAIGSKSRSPGQILVKNFLHSLSYIFGLSTVTQVSDAGPSWPSCFIFFLTKKKSISYPCSYVPPFSTFVFVAKQVVCKDWFHWCMPSFIANEIQEYQNRITVDLACFIYYTEAMFSIIVNQLFIRNISRPFSTEKTERCSKWSLLWRKD